MTTITGAYAALKGIEAMKQNNVKRIVVCDDSRQVLGMITRSDLLRVFFDRHTQAGED